MIQILRHCSGHALRLRPDKKRRGSVPERQAGAQDDSFGLFFPESEGINQNGILFGEKNLTKILGKFS